MSCCGRSAVRGKVDFCGSLRITTGVTLTNTNGVWNITTRLNGSSVPLLAIIAKNQCPKSAASVLAKVINKALQIASKGGNEASLQSKAGRQMPMILLKSFLFGIVPNCQSCKGIGCQSCGGMGVLDV